MQQVLDPALYWRRIRGSDRFGECLRVLLAMGGIVGYCLVAGAVAAVIPALLGAIACALAETEEHWRTRLGTVLVTLACFAAMALAVEWLLPWPWAFVLALPVMSFVLVMLGAISGRYATIAGATLILAVYTMIGVDAARGSGAAGLLHETLRLLAGAAWYGLLSLLWSAVAPQQALRLALARLFDALAAYLEARAALFAPVHGVDREALQLAVATGNARVVQALNDTRLLLIDRIGSRRPRGDTAARLQLYFMAQDIHERVSSAHYPYDALAQALFHSDVLFRCEHLLRLQAAQCHTRADALRLDAPPAPAGGAAHAAAQDLQEALARTAQSTPLPEHLLNAVRALVRNLGAIQALLDQNTPALAPPQEQDNLLQDPTPQTPGEAWQRVRIQLTPGSLHFRHALRLSLALAAGYAIIALAHPQHGYWILLTTLLVSQPSYGATRRLLWQRIAGTVLGLMAGWASLQLVPDGALQMLLVVLTGVGFFAARQRRYTLATAFITLFVLLCFNQIGSGYAVMWARLLDTLVGAALAALAIHLVLPEWRGRRLDTVLAEAVRADAAYLAQIIGQYASGRRDDLPYRIARRDAHNAMAALGALIAGMLREPSRAPRDRERLLRSLMAAHALLGHLSSLGVHRRQITDPAARDAVTHAGSGMHERLDHLADRLADAGARALAPDEAHAAAAKADETLVDETPTDDQRSDGAPASDELARLVLGQLMLMRDTHDRLTALAREPAAS
ncbi:YccS family putative transporter [Dyella sp.]|jgi:YccS/YhfK family integral membrane protein|uniref:YccS family putative transporter n=1 Tax=Dyella sp. TaxID=1869338 RepID=UPI002D782CE3|nr:YccS family putative transporter [Dyella sp.]HET6431241.1 YccS family putative transporter [Dyella sp.]